MRLAPFAPTVQITTGGACHLEIPLVERAYQELDEHDLDFLFIEDVGNLICPASHDLGEHLRVLVLSTTEGDDKPGKYPKAFRTSDVLVVTKTDLLPHVPFLVNSAEQDARRHSARARPVSVVRLVGRRRRRAGATFCRRRRTARNCWPIHRRRRDLGTRSPD